MIDKKSIFLIAKAIPPTIGGVESYSEAVLEAYVKAGHRVIVLTQFGEEAGWSARNYGDGSAKIYNIGPCSQPIAMLKFAFAARKIIKENDFDFCHATTWRAMFASRLLKKTDPIGLTIHGREILNHPFGLGRSMMNCLTSADKVFTVSDATLKLAQGVLDGRKTKGAYKRNYNGISFRDKAEKFVSDKDYTGKLRFLTLTRLAPRKNIQGCLRSLGRLKREGYTDFIYNIGGKGSELDQLIAITKQENLENEVNFLGFVPDSEMAETYMDHHIFLHPQTKEGIGNDFEGFGLVIADAMSFGCAVVVGEAGGPSDFIYDEQNGMLVDGLNNDQLTSAIRTLIDDRDTLSSIAERGREFALEEFSWDVHIQNIISELGEKRL